MLKKIIHGYSAFIHLLEIAVKFFSIFILTLLIGVVFFQVISRILIQKSFVQVEELSIVLVAWLGFFTLAYATRKKIHVRIDVFVNAFPIKVQLLLSIGIDLLVIIATFFLIRYGINLTIRKMMVPLMILPFPAGIQYLSFPL